MSFDPNAKHRIEQEAEAAHDPLAQDLSIRVPPPASGSNMDPSPEQLEAAKRNPLAPPKPEVRDRSLFARPGRKRRGR